MNIIFSGATLIISSREGTGLMESSFPRYPVELRPQKRRPGPPSQSIVIRESGAADERSDRRPDPAELNPFGTAFAIVK